MGLFDEVVPVDLRISYFSAQVLFLGANLKKWMNHGLNGSMKTRHFSAATLTAKLPAFV